MRQDVNAVTELPMKYIYIRKKYIDIILLNILNTRHKRYLRLARVEVAV